MKLFKVGDRMLTESEMNAEAVKAGTIKLIVIAGVTVAAHIACHVIANKIKNSEN